MRRVLVRSIWAVAALLGAVTVLVLFLLTTQPGAALVIGYLDGRLPIDLAVEDVEGRLIGPLELENVRLAVSGVTFDVDQLRVDWSPFLLLRARRVHLESVRIDGLHATVQGNAQADAPADSTVGKPTEGAGTDSLALPIQVQFADLRLSNGSLSIPDVLELRDVRLHARGNSGSYTVDLSALADLLDFPAAPVTASGTGSLSSFALDSLHASVLRGELRARGSVSWAPQVNWQLAVAGDTLAPADVAPNPADWPGRLSLAATTRGGLRDGRPSLQIDVDTLSGSLRGQPIAGSLSGRVEGSEYELSRADLDWGQTRIDAAGNISRERLALQFEINAPDLGAALPRASGSISAAGTLGGSPSTPQIAASFHAQDVSIGKTSLDSARARVDLDWAARGRNEARVVLSGLEVADQIVDSAHIELRGSKENHDLTARMVGDRASLTLEAGGGLQGKNWRGDLRQFSFLTEQIGDWRIEDNVRLAVSAGSVELGEMCVVSHEGSLCVGGSWTSEGSWQGTSSLRRLPFTLLGPFLPQGWSATGRLSGELSGRGDGRRVEGADVNLRAETGVLEYPAEQGSEAFRFDAVRLAIHADADSSSADFGLELADTTEAWRSRISGQAILPPIDELTREPTSDGVVEALGDDWRLSLSVEALPLSAFDRFLLEPTRESTLRLQRGSLAIRALADSLSSDFAFEFADTGQGRPGTVSGHAFLPPIDALRREAASEGLGDAIRDEWHLSVVIEALPLSAFDRFLPEDLSLDGSLGGSLAAASAPDGQLSAQFDLVPETAALVRTLEDEVRTLQFVEPSIRMRLDSDGLRAQASLAGARPDSAPHLTLSSQVSLPEYTNIAQPIGSQIMEAELSGGVDLSLIDAVVWEFSGTRGRLAVDLAGHGTVAKPVISGQYTISGQTDVPSLGIQLREIELQATAGPEGTLDITGGLTSGDGRILIEGDAPIIPSQENPGHLAIRGERFLAMQGDQTTLVVSPDLQVLWTGTTVDVTGEVAIPRATIEIIEIPESAVRVSDDVVRLGTESEPRRPMDVTANIRLALGGEILFKGFGFTTNVEGTLQLIEQPGTPTQGRGELVLREGVYRGYGQNLTIDPGRLIFAGPIDDPGLSVRAYRRATDGTRAGFLIGGTLKSPDLQVWSDPAMSESAVLSYVLFGRSAEQGSSAQQAQAGSAAAILGGNILAMSMASQVGLDDARIEAGARQQDAAFYAGKYLSPKLYVAYGTGLFEPIDVIRVRYLISRKLTLQAETGSRDSGDILYRIER
ncbi:MAG: translocation/assembly module TamB domain-containing protein [Gemmatimonadales bacterium]